MSDKRKLVLLTFSIAITGFTAISQGIENRTVPPKHSFGWYFNGSGVLSFTKDNGLQPLSYQTGCIIYDQYRVKPNWFMNVGIGANFIGISSRYHFLNDTDGNLIWQNAPNVIRYYSPIIQAPLSLKRIFEKDGKKWFTGLELGYAPGISLYIAGGTSGNMLNAKTTYRSAAFATFTINRRDEKGRILSKYGLITYFYPHKPVRVAEAPMSNAQLTIGALVGF